MTGRSTRGPADPGGRADTTGPDTAGPRADPPEPFADSGRLGPFPSWRALYATVVVYTAGLIVALYVLTRLLDHSGP